MLKNVLPTPVRSDTALASALRFSVQRLVRRLRSERPESGLTLNQLSAMACLQSRGALTIGDLAQAEKVQPPSMTRTVTSLVELGYVTRAAAETDRRQVLVALTDAGAELLADDRRRRDAWLAQRLRELTADERDLLRRAAPILERLAIA